jgi:hypothetical protein
MGEQLGIGRNGGLVTLVQIAIVLGLGVVLERVTGLVSDGAYDHVMGVSQ